jgi:hypothetical protein
VLLTEKDEAVHPYGSSYGWSDLNTYGEWVNLSNGRFGWSPYAGAGWSPYTNGEWGWYPGMGYTWISGEPWGWLPYHCGLWDFDDNFGWFWMMPMAGCGLWRPSRVSWYSGPGWIGWAPTPLASRPAPVSPGGGQPVRPRPGPGPGPGHLPPRLITVPTAVVQNRQMITPQIVSHTPPTAGSMIEHPPFEPSPQPTSAATSPAPGAGTMSKTNADAATTTPAHAPIGGSGVDFAWRHASAPPTILMGGDAAKESLLLANHNSHSGREPLRAAQGTTLGGHYAMHGSPGEFRGNAFSGGGRNGSAGGMSGPAGGPAISSSSGGSGAIIASHGSSGGGSSGRGGYSGSSGGHPGGGGGGYSGGGGGGHSGGGGGGGGGGHH